MSKVAKSTLYLMIATLASKILGFAREIVLASLYGTSIYSDVYITALNIPSVIFSSIGLAISTAFIPIYFEINCNEGKEKAHEFISNVLNIISLISIIVSLLGFILSKYLVKLFAIGFEGDALNLCISFVKIMIFGIIFIALYNIMASILQINNNFIVPGLIGIPYNIIIIISMILSKKNNIHILALGTLFGMFMQFMFQLPFVLKSGYRYKRIFKIRDKYIKKALFLVGPVFIGVAATQINAMLDRTLASTLMEGSISALNYANRLNGFIMALFITSVSSVIYPKISKFSSESNREEFNNYISKSINSVILIVMPISIGAMILSTPIIKVLFYRGEFGSEAVSMTSIALKFYSIGMVGVGLREILNKVFYSIQDTKTPMRNGIISMVINIVLNLILVKKFEYAGLALATSISAIVCIFLLFVSLKKKIGYFEEDKIMRTTLKSIVSSAIMGVVTYLVYSSLSKMLEVGFINEAISLFGSILIGVIVYGVLLVILKIEEVSIVTDILKKEFKSRI